jgi:hypothetical protein
MYKIVNSTLDWLYRAFWNVAELLRKLLQRWGYLILAGLFALGLFFTRQYWITLGQAPVDNRISVANNDIEVSMWLPSRIQAGETNATEIVFDLRTLPTASQGTRIVSVSLSSPDSAVYIAPSSILSVELDRDSKPRTSSPLTATIEYRHSSQSAEEFDVIALVSDQAPVATLESTVTLDSSFSRTLAAITVVLQFLAVAISAFVGLKNLVTRSAKAKP